jgi:hypothetical protein
MSMIEEPQRGLSPPGLLSHEKKNHLYKRLIHLVQFLTCQNEARKLVFCCSICNHAASTGFTEYTKLAQITSLMNGNV